MDTNIKGIDLEVMEKIIKKIMKAVDGQPQMEIYIAITYVLTVVMYRCNEEHQIEKRAEIFSYGLMNSIRAFKIDPDKIFVN